VRQRVNIVVAMLSMAAGAWQGTQPQTEQPRSVADLARRTEASPSLTRYECQQKGQPPATFVLSNSGIHGRSPVSMRRQDRVSRAASAAVEHLNVGSSAGVSRMPAGTASRRSRMRPTTAASVTGACE
jgi:hypothetical protein